MESRGEAIAADYRVGAGFTEEVTVESGLEG